MDIYWAYFFRSWVGGADALFDPLQWVLPNKSRFPLFHVKDGKEWLKTATPMPLTVQGSPFGGGAGPTYPLNDGITDIGQGDVPFKSFFGKMGEINKHWYLWERDTASSNPHGSLTSARASYLMMRNDHMARPSRW
jgi:sugar phosphate isomerase/epimerase